MFFRLTLDTPYAFAVENGYNLAKHCADFRTPAGSLTNCYREPVTGLVMLQPTFMTPQYPISQTGLSDFRTTVKPGFWQNTLRGLSNAPMFTSGKPAGSDPNDIAISAAPYLPVINPGATDTLVWTFESQFTLKPDEGFVWYEWSVSDEVNRETNWFAVQWDNVLIHFSGDGTARVYSYADRTQLTVAPTLIDTFQIATATQLHQKYNYFWFQPIPGMGLLLQHASYPMGIKTTLSSADHRSVNGHLIPATPRQMPDGTNRQFDASPLRIAQNPHYDFIFGCDRIQFAASGTYTDAAFDIGYQPSVGIGAASPLVLFSEQQNITLTTLDNAAEFAWTPPMQQGRAQLSLTTSDTSYTPFLFGYNIIWPPLFNTRNTTPVVLSSTGLPGNLDISERLEFTQDEKGDFEGSATMILGSAAAQAIADRGDATFVLESSTDGATWTTIDGGLAKNWEYDVISYMGNAEAYHAKCTLHGLRERFREPGQDNSPTR